MSVLILLDQLPRNCYRGEESAIVFTYFDPLASRIALQALEAGIPRESSLVRCRLAHRMWLQMPLMHSEDTAMHERALEEYDAIAADVEDLVREDRELRGLTEDELECREVLLRKIDDARKFIASMKGFEERHYAIIRRFGRYPHRNAALGRTPIKEEIEYLANGGDTFG
jgi:uncharacterized protein (DUF924 family)